MFRVELTKQGITHRKGFFSGDWFWGQFDFVIRENLVDGSYIYKLHFK